MQAALVEMLRALLHGDFEAVDRHVYEVEWDAGTELLNAAFWLAVNRRFTTSASEQEIAGYVAELNQRYEIIEPSVAEAMIRAARGEDHLVDGLDPETALPVEMVLVHELVADQQPTDEQLEEFVAETLELAQQAVRV